MQLLPGISVLMMVVVVPPELLLLPGNRFAVGEKKKSTTVISNQPGANRRIYLEKSYWSRPQDEVNTTALKYLRYLRWILDRGI